MLKPCNHVAGKSLLPPAALQKSDSALADMLVNPAPAPGSLELSLPSATLLGGFYLSALASAETGLGDSGLSCGCGDAELGAFPGRFVVL